MSWRLMLMGLAVVLAATGARAQDAAATDEKVEAVLEHMQGRWRDMNVPEQDGRLLYEIVLEKGFTSALEVGTSTGHSSLWIAWALSRNGGRLITLEIDEERHREARAHFEEAGLAPFIDARLGDAHQLVEELPGPFDFVFIDADKGWYVSYAKALIPKLAPGGCITAHNVHEPGSGRRGGGRGTAAYLEYMKSLPQFETHVHPGSFGGLAVSCTAPR